MEATNKNNHNTDIDDYLSMKAYIADAFAAAFRVDMDDKSRSDICVCLMMLNDMVEEEHRNQTKTEANG